MKSESRRMAAPQAGPLQVQAPLEILPYGRDKVEGIVTARRGEVVG